MPGQLFRSIIGIAAIIAGLLVFPYQAAAQTQTVNIYLVALEDNGESGMLIGCNDSLIPVEVQVESANTSEAMIQAALERLFSIDEQYYGESGLYNSLHQSNLTVQSVSLENGHATVNLSGSLQIGGVCDEPRVDQQIRQTIVQFNGVDSALIMLNGQELFESPNQRYFPETGHQVTGRFLTVWEATGGLPVYGYPLTDRIQVDGATVQYFERYRFELHPENAQPYDVLFGRLGYDAAQRRGLLNTEPFQPVQAASDANCTYFEATQHRLCFGFRTHWENNGREFGDSGVSMRESLLLYGYPISEEFVDPESGLVTQYFERAVFQWQPNNQPPWDILLQRLGVESLIQ